MSFTAPKSETPSKRLVHYTGPINHCACRTGLLEWTTSVVGEMSVCGEFRQEPTEMPSNSDSFHKKKLKVVMLPGRKD